MSSKTQIILCGARRRDGGSCRAPAVSQASGNGRCRKHGGNCLAWGFAPRWRVTHGSVVRDMVAAGWLPEGTRSAPFELAVQFLDNQAEGSANGDCATVGEITPCSGASSHACISRLEAPTHGDVWQRRSYALLARCLAWLLRGAGCPRAWYLPRYALPVAC